MTSYAEVVLAPSAADAAHPGFQQPFRANRILAQQPAILCTRRPRSASEKAAVALELAAWPGRRAGEVSCETDRSQFIGRGRTLGAPPRLYRRPGPLSNTVGSVLDPIIALRRTVTLAPHETARVDLVMGIAETREAALALVEKYHNPRMADRALDLAWTHSQVTLRHLNASEADAQLYARLAGCFNLCQSRPARHSKRSA